MIRHIIASVLPLLVLACSAPDGSDRIAKNPDFLENGVEKCSLPTLERQLFGVVLGEHNISVAFKGFLKSGDAELSVYYFESIRLQNYRQTNRILLIRPGCSFFGQFVVPMEPSRVSGPDIWFDDAQYAGNVIHFDNGIPPEWVVIDGDICVFSDD